MRGRNQEEETKREGLGGGMKLPHYGERLWSLGSLDCGTAMEATVYGQSYGAMSLWL
jgi:hypothetical protein